MSTLVLWIGIAVTFLTVWGVIMVGSYLLRSGPTEVTSTAGSDWVSPSTDLAEEGLL
jgi:hypothetical protein